MKRVLALSLSIVVSSMLVTLAGEAPAPPQSEPSTDETVVPDTCPEPALGVEEGGMCVEAPAPAADTRIDEFDATPVARGACKACKNRSWCTCTYNGKPRISCDPCCYQGALDPYPVCLD